MEVFISNLNEINNDIESFVIAKGKIEKDLIENGEIETKMSIADFIKYIDFSRAIVYFDKTISKMPKSVCIIPIKLSNDDLVIFYTSEYDTKYNEELFKELEKIEYDFTKLKKITAVDLLSSELEKYFLINGEFHIL